MKPGQKFIHAQWLDENNNPLVCIVTAVRRGLVYWRRADAKKAKDFFPIEETWKRVKEMC